MKKNIPLFLVLALLLFLIPASQVLALEEEILIPNEPLTSHLASKKESKIYQISLPENGSLQLCFRFVPGGDYYLYLYEQTDNGMLNQLQRTNFYFRGETITGSVTRAAEKLRLPAGDYYVKVEPFPNGTFSSDDYTITAVFDEESSDSYEKEFNDSAVKAMKLHSDRPVTGNLSSSSDEDYYSFELMENSSVQLSFRFVPEADYFVIISEVDEGGGLRQILKTNFYSNTSSETGFIVRQTEKLRLPMGLYFVKVIPFNSTSYSNEDYTVTLNIRNESEEIFEKEYNDTGANATPININTEITGNLSSNNSQDYFRFSINEAAAIRIQFRFVPGSDYNVTVLQPCKDGTLEKLQKTNFYHNGEFSDETVVKTSEPLDLAEGDYYIQVASFNSSVPNDDYSFTILH